MKRSKSLLVFMVSSFLLPYLPLSAQGAALEMNGEGDGYGRERNHDSGEPGNPLTGEIPLT
jgi:hypothetical protein